MVIMLVLVMLISFVIFFMFGIFQSEMEAINLDYNILEKF